MASQKAGYNSQTRIYAKLLAADAMDSATIVGLLDANTTEATKAADDWDEIETFVTDAVDATKTDSGELGDEVAEFSSFIGEPQQETVYYYNGEVRGVSRPLPSAGQSFSFTLAEYDRADAFQASLEDASGTSRKFDLVAVTATDGKVAASTGGTEEATARVASGTLNVARVPFGAGNERLALECTVEISKTRVLDQA